MMKHLAWIAAGVALVIVARFLVAEDELRGTAKKLPPLKVNKAAPLRLKEKPPDEEEPFDPAKPRANNNSCFVCHGNFQDEQMVTVHAKENIGCIKCHGSSTAHRNDEDNVTAPDKMFAPARVDKSCGECHEGHDAPVRKVVRMFQERFPPGTDPKEALCTDCHGEHRLRVRSVRWDKNTGKLLAHDPEAAKRTGVERKKTDGAKQ